MTTVDQWRRVDVPRLRGGRPAIVRGPAPELAGPADPVALATDVTAGLADRFTDVWAVDAVAERAGVRLVHAATGPDGEGVVIETLVGADVACWVSPVPRYLAEREAARRAIAGRPPSAAHPSDPDSGVRVAEAYLSCVPEPLVVRCRGPLAHLLPADRAVPASTVPGLLFALVGCGPRPLPGDGSMVVTTRSTLDRLLAADGALSGVPEAVDFDSSGAAEFVARRPAHWWLDWSYGRDVAQLPADEDWSTAVVQRQGRLEVLDAGPDGGLWRVLTDLPEALADDLAAAPGEEPVALVRSTGLAVFDELAQLVA
ncbi:hypothetical protein [Luedemannella helvata]|uniref:Uncharacterized protein n=1 Tax=Luedemannella helvata TaxID=349315 RepID=A0ABN2KFP3_9ACTN